MSIATRSELAPTDLSLRFGLHWGATLYIGPKHLPEAEAKSPRSATK
jgi:hypothetical protein